MIHMEQCQISTTLQKTFRETQVNGATSGKHDGRGIHFEHLFRTSTFVTHPSGPGSRCSMAAMMYTLWVPPNLEAVDGRQRAVANDVLSLGLPPQTSSSAMIVSGHVGYVVAESRTLVLCMMPHDGGWRPALRWSFSAPKTSE